MIDTHPAACNLCGGKVILCSNARIYHGREYGSGLCYYCLDCGDKMNLRRKIIVVWLIL